MKVQLTPEGGVLIALAPSEVRLANPTVSSTGKTFQVAQVSEMTEFACGPRYDDDELALGQPGKAPVRIRLYMEGVMKTETDAQAATRLKREADQRVANEFLYGV